MQLGEHVDHGRGDGAVRRQPREGKGKEVEPVAQPQVRDARRLQHRRPRAREQVRAQADARVSHRAHVRARRQHGAHVRPQRDRRHGEHGALQRLDELEQPVPLADRRLAVAQPRHRPPPLAHVARGGVEASWRLGSVHGPAAVLHPLRRLADRVEHLPQRVGRRGSAPAPQRRPAVEGVPAALEGVRAAAGDVVCLADQHLVAVLCAQRPRA
mmetsp:Transcript_30817/g.96472  ORF Transcript_30817/g.96472 Transcript_30817/m.96472 type:complete len:213 (-) Transcript_30817:22-660(-)